jgi:hypothetical protein
MPPQDREIPPEAREVSYPTIVNPNPGGLGQRRQNNGLSIFSLPTVENTPKNRQNRHVVFTAQNPILINPGTIAILVNPSLTKQPTGCD